MDDLSNQMRHQLQELTGLMQAFHEDDGRGFAEFSFWHDGRNATSRFASWTGEAHRPRVHMIPGDRQIRLGRKGPEMTDPERGLDRMELLLGNIIAIEGLRDESRAGTWLRLGYRQGAGFTMTSRYGNRFRHWAPGPSEGRDMTFGHMDPIEVAVIAAAPRGADIGEAELCNSAAPPVQAGAMVLPKLLSEGYLEDVTPRGARKTQLRLTAAGEAVRDELETLGFQPSAIGDQGMIDLYAQGACHVFALAARDRFRGKGYRVLLDPFDPILPGDEETPAVLPVVHVYAIVEIDGDDWAMDIHGLRPLENAQDEAAARYAAGITALRDLPSDTELMALCVQEGMPAAPLPAVSEAQIDRARSLAVRIFPALAERGLPAPEF